MRRRTLLAAAAFGLAGCTSGSDPSTERSPTDSSNSTRSDSTTRSPTPSYPTKVVLGAMQVEYFYHDTADALRYWDGESLSRIEPDNDRWVQTALTIKNLGGDSIETPPMDDFSLLTPDRSFEPQELPVDRSKLRDPTANWSSGSSKSTIRGGSQTTLDLVFDATANDSRDLIRYEGEETVTLRETRAVKIVDD